MKQAIQTQVFILLGPPGAGKGSQAALLKKELQLAHISTGDLLRANIREGTPLGKEAQEFMDAGQLVPDELIFDMLFTRVAQEDCKRGYMLDGFPRNLEQAQKLQKHLKQVDLRALCFAVADEILVERITQRQICQDCQTPYHLKFSPSKDGKACDACGGKLFQRNDDTKEVVEKRLLVYHEKTAPLIDFYNDLGLLDVIDAAQSKEAVHKLLLNSMRS